MSDRNEPGGSSPPSKRPRNSDDEEDNNRKAPDGIRTDMTISPSPDSEANNKVAHTELHLQQQQQKPQKNANEEEEPPPKQQQQQDEINNIPDLPVDLIVTRIVPFVIDCRFTCNNVAFTSQEIRNAILSKVDLPWPKNIVLGQISGIHPSTEDNNDDEFEQYDDDVVEVDSDNGGDNEDDNSSSSSASTCDDGFGNDGDHENNQVGNEEEPTAKPCILVTTSSKTGRDGYVGVCSSYGTLADAMDDRGGYDADRFLHCQFDIWNCQTGQHFHKKCKREYVLQINFSPIHPYIFISSHHDGRIVIWDLQLSLSESASITEEYDGMMDVHNVASTRSRSILLQERQELEFPDEITNIHFAPNGLIALIHSYEFSLWSYSTNNHHMTCLKRYDMSGDIPASNFSAFTTTRTPSWVCCSDNGNYDSGKDSEHCDHIIAVGQLLEGISMWKIPEISLPSSNSTSPSSHQQFEYDNHSVTPNSRSELSRIQITSLPITVFPFRKMGFSPSAAATITSSTIPTKQQQQSHKAHLAVMIGDRYIQIITIPDGVEVRRLTSPTRISDFAFSLDGDIIAILTLGAIVLYDVVTLKILSRVFPSDRIGGDVGEVLSFSFASETNVENNVNNGRRHVLAVVCKGSNNNNVCCLIHV